MKRIAGLLVAVVLVAGGRALAAPAMGERELEELRRARQPEIQEARLYAESWRTLRFYDGRMAHLSGCSGLGVMPRSPLGGAALRVIEAKLRLASAEKTSITAELDAEVTRERVLRGGAGFEGAMTDLKRSTLRMHAATVAYARAEIELGAALVVYKDLGAPHGYEQPRDYSFLKGTGDLACIPAE